MRNLKGLNVKGLIAWGVFLGLLTSPQMKWAVKQIKQLPVLGAVVGNWDFIFQIFLWWFGHVGVWCEQAVMKR